MTLPHEIVFQIIVSIGLRSLLAALLVAGVMRYYEKALSFKQCYLISLVACAVGFALYFAYQLMRDDLGVPRALDSLATIPPIVFTAAIITRLAANYGIKKTRWFGLGARVVFTIWGVLAVIGVVIILLLTAFSH